MLEHLGLVGVSWRQGGSEALAEFALPQEHASAQLQEFAQRLELDELAYLATCNRVELIFARSDRTPVQDLRRDAFRLLTGRAAAHGEAERRLRAWQGEGAAEHLFLTAAGLDSACVGETEIVGQVRYSQERALELGLCGPSLGLVFEEALRIAGRVRGGTKLAEGRVSLAEIAVQRLRERIARTPGRIALVGVSPMTERAAVSLAEAGLDFTVVNRTVEKAAALAARHGAAHSSLEAFRREPPAVEALLTATGAGEPVLNQASLERLAAQTASGQPPLIVDMAVPGDVDAALCAKLAIPRIGMDEIVRHAEQSRAARLLEAGARARAGGPRARRAPRPFHGALLRPAVRRVAAALSAHGRGRREAVAQEGVEGSRRDRARGDRDLGRGARAPLRAHPLPWGCAACCTTGPTARSRRS